MQPIRILTEGLAKLAHQQRYLFTPSDLRGLLRQLSSVSFKTLLSRAVKEGYLERVCRGLYLYPPANPKDGLLLFHAAARLRADEFNYLSLETVLSDAGAISQVPINWISLMSSGRSNIINCGHWGSIEFVHTSRKAEELQDQLIYDSRCGLWRATVPLALRDMRATRRSLDLVDRSVIDEFI
ncbi:MAG: type IV toxin-antitoxin system AbiEi family antitoxin [Candidatus Berkiellales bacterium]